MDLTLSLLGTFDVRVDGEPVTGFRSNKARALLAYLALEAAHPLQRSKLAALFWPDCTNAAARTNLRHVLSNLGKILGQKAGAMPLLTITHTTVQFNCTHGCRLDVAQLEAALPEPDMDPALLTPTQIAQMRTAVEGYRGRFLDGFSLEDNWEFEDWQQRTQARLHDAVQCAVRCLVEYDEAQGETAQALSDARRWLALEPAAEEAHRRVMQLLARQGNRTAALEQYETCHRTLAAELDVPPSPETVALYEAIKTGGGSACVDWGEAPEVRSFFGRSGDLNTLAQWLVRDRCHLVALVGTGGMGKTALAVKLVQQVANQFDVVIWRSLLNAPPPADLLRDLIQVLSDQHAEALPAAFDKQVRLLLDYLRRRRVLLVFDNLESVLQQNEHTGHWRSGYEGYSEMLRVIGEGGHASTLLLTSREEPGEVERRVRRGQRVRVHRLQGVEGDAARSILQTQQVEAPDAQAMLLAQRYSGNPLALHLVAETIREFYAADVDAFLAGETPIFADVRHVLDQQFARLAPLEHEILYWLAIEREPITADRLWQALVGVHARHACLEALHSLQRRCLLEQGKGRFTLQNVIAEYTTDRLIDEIGQELESGRLHRFKRHALIMATAREYVRQSQIRLILQPIAERLVAKWGWDGVQARLCSLLETLGRGVNAGPDYAGGNLINLLVQLKADLRGYDFSQLHVRQADLRTISLHGVDFTRTAFSQSAFTESFSIVESVAVSPDGQFFAAVSENGEARIWHTADGRLYRFFRDGNGMLHGLAFSPDSAYLAIGGNDPDVRLWDIHSQQWARLQGHMASVNAVAFGPTGSTLVTGGSDGQILVWNVHSRQLCSRLLGHASSVRTVAVSPDGHSVASGARDGTIRLWHLQSEQTALVLDAYTDNVWSVAFHPQSKILASGGYDGVVRLWDTQSGQLRCAIEGQDWLMCPVAFDPAGQRLATCDASNAIRLWNPETGSPLLTLHGHQGTVHSLDFTPDGETLISGGEDMTVRVWNIRSGQLLRTHQGYLIRNWTVAASPNSRWIAVGDIHAGIHLWDVEQRQHLRSWNGRTNGSVKSILFTPDGNRLISGGNDPAIRMWDARTGTHLQVLGRNQTRTRSLALSPDGACLASIDDGILSVWDISSGRCLYRLPTTQGYSHHIEAVVFSPDGKLIATGGSGEKAARLWRVATGDCVGTLLGPEHGVRSLSFAPNGTLACGSMGQAVHLWDPQTGELVDVLRGQGNGSTFVACHPQKAFLASGSTDGTLLLWNLQTGALMRNLRGHTLSIWAVTFSPNGQWLASCGDDGTRVWDVESGNLLRTFHTPGPYAGMNITGATGLTPAQRQALKALGAVDDP